MEKRVEDLTHQVHREILSRCVEQIKTLAPILICSMKIFIQILTQQGAGTDEAIANRSYLAGRMHEEISEVRSEIYPYILMAELAQIGPDIEQTK